MYQKPPVRVTAKGRNAIELFVQRPVLSETLLEDRLVSIWVWCWGQGRVHRRVRQGLTSGIRRVAQTGQHEQIKLI